MGRIQDRRIIILIVSFAVVGALIYRGAPDEGPVAKAPLHQALSHLPGWQSMFSSEISREVIGAIGVDDYVNQVYVNDEQRVALFVGYYGKAEKVGASHSPLVCFPGQGWVVSDAKERKIDLGTRSLHISSMIVSQGERSDLVLYWFQAYDRTAPGTFLQKVYLLKAKLLDNREENAFVRVTVSIGDGTVEEGYQTGVAFIRAFYPRFLEFLKAGDV